MSAESWFAGFIAAFVLAALLIRNLLPADIEQAWICRFFGHRWIDIYTYQVCGRCCASTEHGWPPLPKPWPKPPEPPPSPQQHD